MEKGGRDFLEIKGQQTKTGFKWKSKDLFSTAPYGHHSNRRAGAKEF
jgi:hypothetical protein